MHDLALSKNVAFVLFSRVGNDNLASQDERKLQKRIDSLHETDLIKISDLNTLKNAFEASSSSDPYYISPTYYAVTGRRGLWLYKHQDDQGAQTAMLLCLHPNLKDTVLIFPPFGEHPAEAIKAFVDKISDLNVKIQIARVTEPQIASWKLKDFKRVDESVLDWKFPVHTIDCAELCAHEGGAYARIRQTVNKFRKANAQIREIDFVQDAPMISRLAQSWEGNTSHYDNYDVTFNDYFGRLGLLAKREPALGLRGLVVTINGEDKGFSIWEPGKTANLFASQVADFSMTNLATYLTVESARKMREEGSEALCLGGSENEGMDRYKRGFVPAQSTTLHTLEYEPS